MTPRGETRKTEPAERPWAAACLRFFASLKLAVSLLVLLAAILAVTTLVEAARGREYVLWYVYNSPWFAALLGLLAANILAAAVVRFPWKRHQFAFLITHAGLLVLLAGAIQTFTGGVEGQLAIEEGQTGERIMLRDHSRFIAQWVETNGREDRERAMFSFKPGPVDWPDGKTLDLGQASGVHLRVTRFLNHCQTNEDWVADDSGRGEPALKFAVAGPDGSPVGEEWLVAGPFGAEAQITPMSFWFQRLPADTMLDDFLNPPKDMDAAGVLSVHYQGQVQRIPVTGNVGKKVPLGDSGASLEVTEYYPNAKPASDNKFVTEGDKPKNPLVDMRIYVPDNKEPFRQVAFALNPMLNHDGIHGRSCPVKVWYHHPAVPVRPGVEFVQTTGGKLCCRVGVSGKNQPRGAVHEGDQLELGGKFRVTVVKHLAHARQEISFQPLDMPHGAGDGPEAAALVEVTVGGETQEVWLKRNDQEQGIRKLNTAEGPLVLAFGYEYLPLGFSLKLLKFTHGMNPGGMGDASYASTVRLMDKSHDVDQEREISMNQPLVHNQLAFYQSSFQESPDGKSISVLSVAYDPGRFLKYLGSVMICAGTLLMFCRKATWFGGLPPGRLGRRSAEESRSSSFVENH
jgi:hypothetical protein